MKRTEIAEIQKLNMMPLNGCVLYPRQYLYLECEHEKQIENLESALKENRPFFLVAQRKLTKLRGPKIFLKDLFRVGVIASIEQVQKKNNEEAKVLVKGLSRASLINIINEDGALFAEVCDYKANKKQKKVVENTDFENALIRTVKEVFMDYIKFIPQISKNIIATVKDMNDPFELVNYIASNIALSIEQKQKLLEITDSNEGMITLSEMIGKEINIINYEIEINEKLKNKLNTNQREYFIREQIKILQNEIGEGESKEEEVKNYLSKIDEVLGSKTPVTVKEHLIKEVKKLSKTSVGSQEAAVIKNYLDTCLSLPWQKESKERVDVIEAEKVLNKTHFGLKKVKEHILEMIAIKEKSPKTKWQILCLIGSPGVGKTSIAKSIAEAINRKYVQISLGGVRDEGEIRGHRKTYVGAMQGKIINALITAKTNNPVILLDEIDKMANDAHSDPIAAFLEILDYEQNKNFVDNYIEVPFDLSNVLFITTANCAEDIPLPLYDRMDVITLGSYTCKEKFEIVKHYIIPKQFSEYSQTSEQIKIDDSAIYKIINSYTKEAGVRAAARMIGELCRKAAKKMLESGVKSVKFTENNLEKYLGRPKYSSSDVLEKNEIGVAQGLAWTQIGGETMCLEAISLSGTGKVELTGSLGDIMKESAKAALSYIRKMSKKLKIKEEFYQNNDIHLHVPEGAVPKDGPSAGTAISTAIVSELIKKPIKKDVAITGEITLRGKVLPVGGIKEKVLAAYRVGIKTVVLPKENEIDLEEIDADVKKSLNFVFVKDVNTVWKTAIVGFE